MTLEPFGRDVGDFLRGLLDIPPAYPKDTSRTYQENNPYDRELHQDSDYSSNCQTDRFPRDYKLWGDINNAPKLKPGNLLVVHLATNHCYQVDPETGEITFLFSLHWGPRTFMWRAIAHPDGSIYCSLSGSIASIDGVVPPRYEPPAAKFAYWGAIVRINHRQGTIETLVETKSPGMGLVQDPHGIQMLNDDQILVSDFQGFGSGGAIYTVNRFSGSIELLSQNGLLTCNVNVLRDEDNILWIANADMSEENDGEIIRITPDGKQEIFLPRSGKNSGQIVGVLQAHKPDELVIFRCEWPNLRGNSAVFLLNKKTKETEMLFRSTVDDPRFYNTNGDVNGNMLWFGESVRKEIIGYDLVKREVVKTIDFRGVAGGWRGMIDSYDGIESVTVIPNNIRGQ